MCRYNVRISWHRIFFHSEESEQYVKETTSDFLSLQTKLEINTGQAAQTRSTLLTATPQVNGKV